MRDDGFGEDLLVVHADWSIHAAKRWMAMSPRTGSGWRCRGPKVVPEPQDFFARLQGLASSKASILVGFDFPIGLPFAFARRAGVTDFRHLLPQLGEAEWRDFYEVAEVREQISTRRPFYPRRPGGTRRDHLLAGLGLEASDDLLRICEKKHPDRPAASPLFWTLGAKQVGKAAIAGWRQVLTPALRNPELDVVIWPFDGDLEDLLDDHRVVLAETYPAEAYRHIGVEFARGRAGEKHGKTVRADRAANAQRLLDWARDARIELAPELAASIRDGFGSDSAGEDRFDAVVGLFGMLEVVLMRREAGAPDDPRVRRVEGWILGQRAVEQATLGSPTR